jgi:hypothetical protein
MAPLNSTEETAVPTINQLTRTDTVSAGDVVPVYIQNQGDARGAALSVLQEFMQENLNFDSQAQGTQYAAPSATGFSIAINAGPQSTHLILTPTGTFAAGTLVLPAVATAIDRQSLTVNTTQIVTALTINGNGATAVIGVPTTLAANAFFTIKFDLATKNWYRVA